MNMATTAAYHSVWVVGECSRLTHDEGSLEGDEATLRHTDGVGVARQLRHARHGAPVQLSVTGRRRVATTGLAHHRGQRPAECLAHGEKDYERLVSEWCS